MPVSNVLISLSATYKIVYEVVRSYFFSKLFGSKRLAEYVPTFNEPDYRKHFLNVIPSATRHLPQLHPLKEQF
jgi:hypothetical protein